MHYITAHKAKLPNPLAVAEVRVVVKFFQRLTYLDVGPDLSERGDLALHLIGPFGPGQHNV